MGAVYAQKTRGVYSSGSAGMRVRVSGAAITECLNLSGHSEELFL